MQNGHQLREEQRRAAAAYEVGRCTLQPVFARTGYDVLRFGSLTQCPCVILCNLTTRHSIESAGFQRLKLNCDEPRSSFAFNFNVSRYAEARVWGAASHARHAADQQAEYYAARSAFRRQNVAAGRRADLGGMLQAETV